jgi:hypothetical protein
VTSVRGQLRARRVAELAERQRRRTGIWFNQAGRLCQHCPACGTTISISDPPGSDDPAGFDAYARAVDDHLDDAVYHHLLLDLCPTPERAL